MRGRVPEFFNLIFSNTTCSVSAVHAVTDDIRIKTFFNEIVKVVTANYLVRYQTHYGSALECQANLSAFGIPPKILPLSVDGQVHCIDHASFLSQLEKMESEQDLDCHDISYHPFHDVASDEERRRFSIIENLTPGPKDIILGKGKRASRYLGNMKLRDIIEEHYEVYANGRSESRKVLARSVYSHLVHFGSRFLTYSERDQVWSELDEDTAIGKILHDFRNHRIKVIKQGRDI